MPTCNRLRLPRSPQCILALAVDSLAVAHLSISAPCSLMPGPHQRCTSGFGGRTIVTGHMGRKVLCESIPTLFMLAVEPDIGSFIITFIEHLFPLFISSFFFGQYCRDELRPIMPRRKVGQVCSNHLLGVIELWPCHALALKCLTFQVLYHHTSISPTMEVATIPTQHFAHQPQLLLPDLARLRPREQKA